MKEKFLFKSSEDEKEEKRSLFFIEKGVHIDCFSSKQNNKLEDKYVNNKSERT